MKPQTSKSLDTSSGEAPASVAVPSTEASGLASANATLTLSAEQLQELSRQRVQREIQVKTRACLNRPERERLKSYRVAWRKYWPLLPLALVTWLVGAFCLMPRHFQPADLIVVAQQTALPEMQLTHLQSWLEASSVLSVSDDLRALLAPPEHQKELVELWRRQLQSGVRPEMLPKELEKLTGGQLKELLVITTGSWGHGEFQSFSAPDLPPTVGQAVADTAKDFCALHHQPELAGELSDLLVSVCQPNFEYRTDFTRQFVLRNPRATVRPDNSQEALERPDASQPIYRDETSAWRNFTRKNFQYALSNRSFWVSALILAAFLVTYISLVYLVQPEQAGDLRRYVLLCLLLCLEFLAVLGCANFITSQFNVPLPFLLSCLPLAFFPAIICNLLNKRLAFVTATLMAALLPLQLNLPSEHFPIFYFSLLVILASVFQFRDIGRRLEFLSRGLAFGFVLAIAEFLFFLSEGSAANGLDFVRKSVFLLAGALANGLLNGILCILSMVVLEAVFRLPSALSLTEVSNLDEPLLERLRLEAPGTYEHSIAVAELAVAGARTIGANAKLAYAMALYHDIGKLFSPSHFTENLQDGENTPHLRHTPEDSCEYLREHARFGIRLARKHHLPSLIYPAILQHHGNTIMASFYQQACRQATEKGLPKPAQELFRYDQQPPSSKEVALIMLADSCEAATRSITHRKRDSKAEALQLTQAAEEMRRQHSDATPEELAALFEKLLNEQEATAQKDFREQIEDRVRSVIQGKLIDGQFERVDLTTRQLAQLQESFVATLLDKNHTRLEYRK